jgi:actin-related protein
MADETQAGQDPPVSPPSTQAGQDPPVQSPTEQPQAADVQARLKQLEAQLAERTQEAAANRVAAKKLKELQDAQLSEQEKKDRALAEATNQLTQERQARRSVELQNHLLVKATEYGVKQNAVSLLLKALDQSSLYSEDGTLDGKALKEQIAAILKDVPELAVPPPEAPGQPASNAAGTNVARPANSRKDQDPVDLSKPPGWNAVFNRR